MATKLEAAKLVTASGIPMVMCHSRADDAVLRAAQGELVGTYFKPADGKLEARKRWMLSGISQRGRVIVDAGAAGAPAAPAAGDIVVAEEATIDSTVFSPGDNIFVELTAYDGVSVGNTVASHSATAVE